MLKIAAGSDHRGFCLKEIIKNLLSKEQIIFEDFGTYSEDISDYTKFSYKVAKNVSVGNYQRGILCCKTGTGVCITSNKIRGIRAAVCFNEESVKLARRHNDINVLCLGSAFVDVEKVIKIVKIFLKTPFESGRHLPRIQNIDRIESEF
ncbi:MAG: ribose 5-phosphate isomerase B [Oscillospiraceae bacterium]|jgi:ribose 5-phosphate isomerase B|nr:ribose 5-phosphate isomerase B [Oscillospiraceae bacterium]